MAMAAETVASDKGRLDALLEAMPRIAEAVKAFPEAVQAQAFEALMAEARGEQAGSKRTAEGAPAKAATRRRTTTDNTKGAPKKRKGGPTTVKELDLTPKGKDSLKDFIAKKKPDSQHDYNALSVYYLKKFGGVDAVAINHVFTCYKDAGWREPANLANSLALTANRRRYLDTSNLDDIQLTPAGRNHVEFDLPPKPKV
jgi:hypothetical protein